MTMESKFLKLNPQSSFNFVSITNCSFVSLIYREIARYELQVSFLILWEAEGGRGSLVLYPPLPGTFFTPLVPLPLGKWRIRHRWQTFSEISILATRCPPDPFCEVRGTRTFLDKGEEGWEDQSFALSNSVLKWSRWFSDFGLVKELKLTRYILIPKHLSRQATFFDSLP